MNNGIVFLVKIAVFMLIGLIGAFKYEGVRKLFFDYGVVLLIPLVAIAAFFASSEITMSRLQIPLIFPDAKDKQEKNNGSNPKSH